MTIRFYDNQDAHGDGPFDITENDRCGSTTESMLDAIVKDRGGNYAVALRAENPPIGYPSTRADHPFASNESHGLDVSEQRACTGDARRYIVVKRQPDTAEYRTFSIEVYVR